ncbi:hypothetical protein ONS95_012484 [Cadophora gregata]|uniref:uncharacterized protein n=1 Tax=Cadophora gregata TaxID=51156 RepID=UPI0026DBB0D4|nr:uncharacterized protein ONS95_012484 [Cadophora gregata]KAK0118179.1 hypothetical protein ONS95_012484 [Cadophora gregata]KAK0123251.1 hypothetical protein ONS96_010250 [Cadophora gregata f. sp. sojae]
MSQPPFFVLAEGKRDKFSSHDTSRAGYHHQDLAAFSRDVNNAARRAFPNRGRSRYGTVNICLIRWEDDELGVQNEVSALDNVLQSYGFQTNIFLIPGTNSHWDLMRKMIDFIQAYDNDQNLFVLYYAGHGRMNSARQAEWVFRQNPDSPFVDWSAIQGLFGTAKSDVLILLDTCAAASSATTSQFAVMETIAACGFERRAPPPGEHSMTNTLVDVLRDWNNKPSFSAASLHTEILFRLKLKEAKKGREGVPLEWCVTPIHWINTKDCKASGIELCRRTKLPLISDACSTATSDEDDISTYIDAMELDIDDKSSGSTPLSSVSSNGSYKVPHVLISLQLEEDQLLDARQCARWLDKFPLLAKWVKVDAVFPSYSTLMIMSVPMPIWDMLPDHPACSFIGYTTGPNIKRTEVTSSNDSAIRATSNQGVGETARGEHLRYEMSLRIGKTESVVNKEEFQESSSWKSEDMKDELLSDKSDLLPKQSYAMSDVYSSGSGNDNEEAQHNKWMDPSISHPSYPERRRYSSRRNFIDKQLKKVEKKHSDRVPDHKAVVTSDPERVRVHSDITTLTKGKHIGPEVSQSKRSHLPRKNGCSRCLTRRTICDEIRPQCTPCTRAGSRCEGYPSTIPIANAPVAVHPPKKTIAPAGPLVPDILGSLQFSFDSQERQYFQGFQDFMKRDYFGFSTSPFFIRTILQECHSDSSMRPAVLAMGGLYETFHKQNTLHNDFAFKQHKRALEKLLESLENKDTPSNGNILMSIALFFCFQSGIGDPKAAISHLKRGLRVIADSQHDFELDLDDETVRLFARLFIQIKSCDEAFNFPDEIQLSVAESITHPLFPKPYVDEAVLDALPKPTRFTTTEDARRHLEHLQICRIELRDTLTSSHVRSKSQVSVRMSNSANALKEQLLGWSRAFDKLLELRREPGVSSIERIKRAILKMNYLSIAVFPRLYPRSETEFDTFYLEFREIVKLAKEVLVDEDVSFGPRMPGIATDHSSPTSSKISTEHSNLLRQTLRDEQCDPIGTPQSRLQPTPPASSSSQNVRADSRATFTTAIGIVHPLYVVAIKCRNRKLRREAIQILLSSPRREGLWDSLLCGHVAQWAMVLEEEDLPSWNPSERGDSAVSGMIVADDKRVIIREVSFNLQDRTAYCRCGKSGAAEGDPDDRVRLVTLKW